jgi:hypothetical protein
MPQQSFPAYAISTFSADDGGTTSIYGPIHNEHDLKNLTMDLANLPYDVVDKARVEAIARSQGPKDAVDAAWAALDREDGRL